MYLVSNKAHDEKLVRLISEFFNVLSIKPNTLLNMPIKDVEVNLREVYKLIKGMKGI